MEQNVLVDEKTEHGSQKKVVSKMKAKESLEAVVKLLSRDDAEEFMRNSFDYIKNKADEIIHAVKDLQQFFNQNNDLAMLLDPALVVSFSLMDPDAGITDVFKNIATKEAAPRNYKLEAMFGRSVSVNSAVMHLTGQMHD